MFLLNSIGWHVEYFNYWLTHIFYFAALLIILIAWGSNKILYCKNRIMILNRLEVQCRLK
jgi:hypothetical protein